MPIEMFPNNEPMNKVARLHCIIEAECFNDGIDAVEEWMGDESVFFWQTIRDLMLAGF